MNHCFSSMLGKPSNSLSYNRGITQCYFDCIAQVSTNSIANALELLQPYARPSIWSTRLILRRSNLFDCVFFWPAEPQQRLLIVETTRAIIVFHCIEDTASMYADCPLIRRISVQYVVQKICAHVNVISISISRIASQLRKWTQW